ncbi:hypothetical protein GCM10027277_56640 [Pseudoduganella ginsengisoli]
MLSRSLEKLSYAELETFPVWEFVPESAHWDETWVRPVQLLPVRSLSGRLVASRVQLANGRKELALLGNVELEDPQQNEHFMTLSLVKPNGESFDLARYQDVNYEKSGPLALARFLGLQLIDVFPIAYDISEVVSGPAESVRGVILHEPQVQLSEAELIAMAVGG